MVDNTPIYIGPLIILAKKQNKTQKQNIRNQKVLNRAKIFPFVIYDIYTNI